MIADDGTGLILIHLLLAADDFILLIPMAYLMPLWWGLDGVWLSMAASDFGSFAMTIPLLWVFVSRLKASQKSSIL